MNHLIINILLSVSFAFAQTFPGKPLKRSAIPGELLVICESSCIKNIQKGFKSRSKSRVKVLFQGKNKYSMIKVNGVTNREYQNFKTFADRNSHVIIGANYEYSGDPREGFFKQGDNDDPEIDKQDHHDIIKTFSAWKSKAFGNSKIIVAVTDDGVSLDHKDLKKTIWKNTSEIPNNGKDDDGNGYIDDVNGWDFSDDDNDPNGGSHGTHVAGIIGASINNGFGGAGIAPGVQIMPIRWYGGSNRWTSEIIAKSYLYALNNGAKIINTSYNIDGFVNDTVYRDLVKLIKKEGVLIFNSAGNAGRQDPPRSEIEEVVLVAALDSDYEKNKVDSKAYFSNYGDKIDISAPGHPIYSTILRGGYGDMSGTSMASPAAAGVAALIWSQNPELKAQEVLTKLLKGTDDVSKKNSKYKGELGTGRINVPKALNVSSKELEIALYSQNIKQNKRGDFNLVLTASESINKEKVESMEYIYFTQPSLDAPQTYKKLPVEVKFDSINNYITMKLDQTFESGKYIVKIPREYFKYGSSNTVFKGSAKSTRVYEYYIIHIAAKK